VRRYPELEDQLRKLLPGIQMLADLGHAPADRPSPEGPGTSVSHKPVRGVLGDYQIIREVGRGGMGVVYEAEQVSLGRKVAIKVLPFAAMMDQKQLQRFHNEARAAASLRHPNIVQVHFVGCERAVHFYAMDYIEGQTLAELIHHLRRLEGFAGESPEDAGQAVSDLADSLASGRFAPPKGSSDPDAPTAAYGHERTPKEVAGVERSEPPEAETERQPQAAISTERSTKGPAYFRSIAEIGVQVAEALDHAHQNGVIHRDVKPSNVILDNGGKPWVTDFGLARIETDATLTVTGDLLGTVRYMSPEQALAKRIVVDHRTDVYSLGATLYELLTLQPVFTGQDRQELLRQIAFDEPKAPRRLNKAIPEELEIIVTKAMAKNPAERYDTAQELADDLRRFLEDRPIRARRPTLVQRTAKWSRRHKPIVWSAAVSMFLLLVVGLVGLGIGNRMIRKERDEKDAALTAETKALAEKNEALLYAEAERRRAEGNLDLALAAMDTVYLDAIGEGKLLGEPVAKPGFSPRVRQPLSDLERELLKRGLDFYDQFAQQNAAAPRAAVQTAQAYYRVGLLQAGLGETESAEEAYRSAIERLERLTKERPDNPEHFQKLAKADIGLGNVVRQWSDAKDAFEAAIRAYSQAIELRPKDAWLFVARADVHRRCGHRTDQQSDAEAAAQLDPNETRVLVTAAWAYIDDNPSYEDHQKALRYAERALELAPEDPAVYHVLGWIHRGDYQKALLHLDRAVELQPTNCGRLQFRAMLHVDYGKYEAAIADANRMLSIDPSWAAAFGFRAKAYAGLGEYDKALADFSKAEQLASHRPETFRDRGAMQLQRQLYSEALDDLNKAIEISPQVSDLYESRAVVRYHLGQYDKTLDDLELALKLNPTATATLASIPLPLVAACPGSFREGLLELAANSVESEAADHGAHYRHALLCACVGDALKYRGACGAMARKYGETTDPIVANFVAWSCALAPDAVEDYEPVLASVTKAVDAQPDSDQFLPTVGAVLYRAGRHEDAIQRLTELDRRIENPDHNTQTSPPYTRYFLAMAHKKAGNDGQAEEYLKKATKRTDEVLDDKDHPPGWNHRATLELLRKEAEALLGNDDPESAEGDQKPEAEDK